MSLATLIASLRTLASDNTDSNVIYGEKIGDTQFLVDGTNRLFRLRNVPLVGANAGVGNVYLTRPGTSYRIQTGFTITDVANGIITFTVAPTANESIYADYNYYYFSDAKYTEFLNEAASNLLLNATDDPTTVVAGLIPAMMQYALALFFKARASQYQSRYSSSGGEAGQSVESVASGYAKLAAAAEKRGDTMRQAFYENQSQNFSPGVAVANYRIDPITPSH